MMAGYADKNGKDRSVGKKGKVGGGNDAPFRGYINLNLSDEDKQHWLVWSQSASFWDALSFHVGDGVNFSVKTDAKGKGSIASATQRREDSPNAGLVVTARGSDGGVALSRVVYCLVLLGHKDTWEATQPLADPDRW